MDINETKYEQKRSTLAIAAMCEEHQAFYINECGISEQTIRECRLADTIVFGKRKIAEPIYDNEIDVEPVSMNIREPKLPTSEDSMVYGEPLTKRPFWGKWLCNNTDQPLVIARTPLDAMSLHEANIPNCVSDSSVVNIRNANCIGTDEKFLKQFKKIYVVCDKQWRDESENICKRLLALDRDVYIANIDYDSINEQLRKEGIDSLVKAMTDAKRRFNALIRASDVKQIEHKKLFKTYIAELDKRFDISASDVLVITGPPGSAKTTFLSQLAMAAIDQEIPTCFYEGEGGLSRLVYWMNLQAAGRRNISSYLDADGREIHYVEKNKLEKIRKWYADLYLYDVSAKISSENDIIKIFEYAFTHLGCRLFFVDNLMTILASQATLSSTDFNQQQTAFCNRLCEFAAKYSVACILVAHPRKTTGHLEGQDISGSRNIENLATSIIALDRLVETERIKMACDTKLEILKNRAEGTRAKIGLSFDTVSKRMYSTSQGYDWKYKWEAQEEAIFWQEE